jgi:hypothetical protein
MRKLASHIDTELKNQDICAVYNSELARVWPKSISAAKRKRQIKRFAKAHRLAVTFYDVGLCAIFEKPKRPSHDRTLILPLESKQTIRAAKRRTRD